MSNWINFKGVDSRDFDGLIICELPSISKPQMRVEAISIDGKNGDIAEFLGYAAYDKTLKIGLTRSQNIDAVVQYFSGKGEAIFSNEPDKVYRREIIDGVNYERLVKFRVADVKFHTQPYKYLRNEPAVILEIDDQTSLLVENLGLETSLPIITLHGEGIITLSINDVAIFQVDIDDKFVTIDSEKEESYKGNVLKNRFMMGEFPELLQGKNMITWAGNLSKIEVHPKSRWL